MSLRTHARSPARSGPQTARMFSGQPPQPRSSPEARPILFRILQWLTLGLLASLSAAVGSAQDQLPDAPTPNLVAASGPSPLLLDPAPFPAPAAEGQQNFPPEAPRESFTRIPGLNPRFVPIPSQCSAQACTRVPAAPSCCVQNKDVFTEYLNQNTTHIYTPVELGRLAIHGVVDPFNLLTIGGTSAISIAENAHTRYGPGTMGWAKLSGVTLTEDMTGEFVSTFLIPSFDHQDPHYHREPNAPLMRRIVHCIVQPFWTDTDAGGSIVNYSTIAGDVLEEAVDVTYVPYQRTGVGPSAARIATNWATTPIGNFVTEFVPDFASHFNVRVVFIQRIINQVAVEEGGAPQP